jgi:hypothetical protein
MNYVELLLVLISFLFGTTLFVISLIKTPRVRIFGRNATQVDRARFPALIKFLLIVAILSILVGLVATRRLSFIAQFAGLNLLLGAIMGSNIFLLRERPRNK